MQLPVFILMIVSVLWPDTANAGLVACTDPTQCGTCELIATVNNVLGYLTMLATIVATIAIVVGGLGLVTSQGSPAAKQRIKEILMNVFFGFLLVIAAYGIVTAVLQILVPGGSPLAKIGNVQCIRATAPTAGMPDWGVGGYGSGEDSIGVGGGGGSTSGRRGIAQCSEDNLNCSVSYLQSLGLTETQANIMSCVAITENGGGAVGCSGTGPCGTFQINRTNWRNYTEGSNPQISGCSAAEFGGNIVRAQNNGACNARVAAALVRDVGYQPWTGANQNGPWNPNARRCVQNYSNASDRTSRGF